MIKRKATKFTIRLLLLILLCLLISLVAKIFIGILIPDIIFELKYWNYNQKASRMSAKCFLIKNPMIQYIGSMKLMIGWESNCPILPNPTMHLRIIRKSKIESEQTISIDNYTLLDSKHCYYRTVLNETFPIGKRDLEYSIKSGSRVLYSNSFKVLKEDSIKNSNQVMTTKVGVIGNTLNGRSITCGLFQSIKDHKPDLLVHLGNMIINSSSLKDWQRYYDCASMSIPALISMGNSDLIQGTTRPIYISDQQSTENFPFSWFATTIAATRWIVLNSNESEEEQVRWLEHELSHSQSQKATFRIVLIHMPPFSIHAAAMLENDDDGNSVIANKDSLMFGVDRLVPIFERFKVSLVLSAHQSNYQRGFKNGVHYLISGGGGNHLDDEKGFDHKVYTKTIVKHHYMIMDINEDEITVNVMDMKEKIMDQVKIPKALTRKFKPSEIV